MNKILELRVANIAIYIDVPDATEGAIPKSKNNGLNRMQAISKIISNAISVKF
jgi:hypothetical protein